MGLLVVVLLFIVIFLGVIVWLQYRTLCSQAEQHRVLLEENKRLNIALDTALRR